MTPFWEIEPTWQNSIRTLDALKHQNVALGAYVNQKLIGYVIYDPISKGIRQIAVDKDHRRLGTASALVFKLIQDFEHTFSVINVDKESEELNLFLKKLGLTNHLNQFEMELKLKV